MSTEFEEKAIRAFRYVCRCKGKPDMGHISTFMKCFEDILQVELKNSKLFLTIKSSDQTAEKVKDFDIENIKKLIDEEYQKSKPKT